MSNIALGNGGRGVAATAIAVTLILILMASSPVILTTTDAFAASKTNSNKDCSPLKFDGAVESRFSTKQVIQ